jgi:hypothetical protein
MIVQWNKEAVTGTDSVAAGFMRVYKRYVQPYFTCYIGLAQASPFALNKYVEHEDAGEGICLVCNALGLDPDATELELQRVRREVNGTMTHKERIEAHTDLLQWLDSSMLDQPGIWVSSPLALQYICGVLSILVTSHFIEVEFSGWDHLTGNRRSTTSQKTAMSFRRLQSAKRLSANAEEDGADAGKFTPRFVSPFLANN